MGNAEPRRHSMGTYLTPTNMPSQSPYVLSRRFLAL